jgi:phenylpropionate dioxygenase-like ring-hydroxylating dioxygenase large terminal subunit
MNRPQPTFTVGSLTPDDNNNSIPKEEYISAEFAEMERRFLWPRVWQVACREEQLPNVGSYVTYDILDDSVIVVRTGPNEIKAYNNACLHRGRRLTVDCGHTNAFFCKFHGWGWNLQGHNIKVVDHEDWGDSLERGDLKLRQFRVDTWAGFVFVNMDPNAVPLRAHLEPVPQYIDWMEIEKQRCRWHVSVQVEANWKTTQEAFEEAYHVPATHTKYATDFDHRALAIARGQHGQLNFLPFERQVPGLHVGGMRGDARQAVVSFIRGQARDLRSIFTERDYQAATRILTDLSPTATYVEAITLANQYIREAAISSGVGFPDATAEQMANTGFDWTIFPNLVNVIPSATCGFWYRTRPTRENNPDRCIVDMYALERFAPGTEPQIERPHYERWQDWKDMPIFLLEDFINIPEVQRGLKTRGFPGSRPNPVQEVSITNFHRVLREWVGQAAKS